MGDLVDFSKEKLKRSKPEEKRKFNKRGHLQSAGKCLDCQHEWYLVIETPIEAEEGLECPKCGTSRGVLQYPIPLKKGLKAISCKNCKSKNFHFIRHLNLFFSVCVGCGKYFKLN